MQSDANTKNLLMLKLCMEKAKWHFAYRDVTYDKLKFWKSWALVPKSDCNIF